MEPFVVSARKYRPATFKSVVGQESVVTTLQRSIKNNKVGHAYLFCGPRGVGKTTCARIFAKALNCSQLSDTLEPCNSCDSCLSFNQNRAINIHELDAASNNSVDDVRALIDQVRILPQMGDYNVYIVDEVHMLSSSAFNAFLKTLEEPPAHALFILATTEKHKILPTILSRCQVFDFKRITLDDIVQHLLYIASKEEIEVEEKALSVIAKKADGGMRDALSVFDQVVSFTEGKVTYQSVLNHLHLLDYEDYFTLTNYLHDGKIPDTLTLFDNVLSRGFEGSYFIRGLSQHFRDLLVSKDSDSIQLLNVGESLKPNYTKQAIQCEMSFLMEGLNLLNSCELNYKVSQSKRLLIELTLINIIRLRKEWKSVTVKQQEEIIEEPRTSNSTGTAQKEAEETPEKTTQSSDERVREIESQPDYDVQVKEETSSTQKNVNATVVKNKGKNVRSFSISESLQNIETTKKEATEQETTLENDFTQEQLQLAWKHFFNGKEDEFLQKRIGSLNPILGDNYEVTIEVSNNTIASKLNKFTTDILTVLRNELGNRHIKLHVKINTPKNVTKTYTQKEKADLMNEKNSFFEEFRQKFQLEFER